MVALLYGSGLRQMECLRLRIKDLDFANRYIVVRDGKGRRDRATLLPEKIESALRLQIERVRGLYERDLASGFGAAEMGNSRSGVASDTVCALGWQICPLRCFTRTCSRLERQDRGARWTCNRALAITCSRGAGPVLRAPPASGSAHRYRL